MYGASRREDSAGGMEPVGGRTVLRGKELRMREERSSKKRTVGGGREEKAGVPEVMRKHWQFPS